MHNWLYSRTENYARGVKVLSPFPCTLHISEARVLPPSLLQGLGGSTGLEKMPSRTRFHLNLPQRPGLPEVRGSRELQRPDVRGLGGGDRSEMRRHLRETGNRTRSQMTSETVSESSKTV